jgi:hypothetical protein
MLAKKTIGGKKGSLPSLTSTKPMGEHTFINEPCEKKGSFCLHFTFIYLHFAPF